MAATEAEINLLLETLKDLLMKIGPLRKRVDEIEKGQALAQREYDSKLKEANEEADRLDGKLALLNPKKAPPLPPTNPPPPDPIPPPPVIESKLDHGTPAPPPPPKESPRTKRKRNLLDYIYSFTDKDPMIAKINALMDDDRHDMGDLLEMLAWGPIWEARTDFETLDDQWHRLDEWRVALEERLNYWTEECQRLDHDETYNLWRRKSELNENEWQALLDQMLKKQEADNKRLADEVARLEKQHRAQPASEGMTNA